MFKKLISFCLMVAIVRSGTAPYRLPPTISSGVNPTLEELKKHGANPKNKGISLRSLFGLGIGGNLLGAMAVEAMVIWAKGLLANLREANIHSIHSFHTHTIYKICVQNYINSQQLLYTNKPLKECHYRNLQRVTSPLAHKWIALRDLTE
ncbi:hypothetical protein J6590_089153 [Homalodisca vitripennis]|nr:hypothetical protein J6590_089153 [Homalodisca vitripennis]